MHTYVYVCVCLEYFQHIIEDIVTVNSFINKGNINIVNVADLRACLYFKKDVLVNGTEIQER